MKLLRPKLLKKLIQHDRSVTFALAMINHHWSDVIARYGPQTKIDASTVLVAKRLVEAGLFDHPVDFHDYGAVKRYLIRNDNYIGASGKQELLKPFQD